MNISLREGVLFSARRISFFGVYRTYIKNIHHGSNKEKYANSAARRELRGFAKNRI